MEKWIIKIFGLKGSWKWAKKQMLNGQMIRGEDWSRALKLKVDNSENGLLQSNCTRENKAAENGGSLWRAADHYFSFEDVTNFVIFNWPIFATYEGGILTVPKIRGYERHFKGAGTIWYELPSMRRCSTTEEVKLVGMWKYIEHHGKPYPVD